MEDERVFLDREERIRATSEMADIWGWVLLVIGIILLIGGLFVFISPLSFVLFIGYTPITIGLLRGISIGGFVAMCVGATINVALAITALRNE